MFFLVQSFLRALEVVDVRAEYRGDVAPESVFSCDPGNGGESQVFHQEMWKLMFTHRQQRVMKLTP